jgi:hypothetical protein
LKLLDIPSNTSIRVFGICTIILWLSYVVYLPPFVEGPDIKSLVNDGYSMYVLEHPNVSKQQLEMRLLLSIYLSYAKAVILIIAGVMAGFFIIRYKKIGRIIALVLCFIMLGSRVLALLIAYPNTIDNLKVIYVFLLSRRPLEIIHRDIIAPIFFILSIFYLFKKSVIHKFVRVHT